MRKFNRSSVQTLLSGLSAPKAQRRSAVFQLGPLSGCLAVGVLALSAPVSLAVNANWVGTTNSDWAVAINWSATPLPGSTTTLNTDTATFKGGSYQLTVLPDANRCLGYIMFSQLSVGNAGDYVIGSPGGNALHLGQTNGAGSLWIDASLTTPGTTATLAAPLVLHGSYQFLNNTADPSITMVLGDVRSGATGNVDVQLKGGNAGYNRARGVISDGTSTASLTKLNAGTWYVTGTNSTYTKNTIIIQGTLVAGANVPASGPGPFGNTPAAIIVGNATSTAAGDATLLVGDGAVGYTMARPITVQALATGKTQTVGLGGANTSGVSYVKGNISVNRNLILQCATGGTVSFETGVLTSRDKVFTIGRPGYFGTVKIANSLSTTGGVVVSNGTLEVAGTITAAVSVNTGATLAGTGTICGNVVVAENAMCAPGENGVGTLTVTGIATLQSGSHFAAKVSEAGTVSMLTSSGSISLNNVVLDVASPAGFVGTVVIAHADTALTGTFSAASKLPAFCTVVYTPNEAKLRFTTGTLVTIR